MSDSANCKDTQRLIERLRDLLVQATKEKSHFYVARCVRDAINALEAMQARVAELESALRQLEMAESEAVRNHVKQALKEQDE